MVDQQTFTTMTPAEAKNIDDLFFYAGNDLGATWSPESTTFKLWAPTANDVDLVIFDNDRDPQAAESSRIPMSRMTVGDEIAQGIGDPNRDPAQPSGVWTVTVDGNLDDVAYIYRISFPNDDVNDAPDPYATAAVANGHRSVVLSDEHRSIGTFPRMAPFSEPTDAVIAETHIRDFTKDESSGVPEKLRGTYLGMIEPGTVNAAGKPTGLDYLKQLGITHLQIQPMFDFASVDETAPLNDSNYNWGYDPENYNVPEGSFSTNANDPSVRIRELKTMVKGLHDAGIRVVMDVVYNHVFDAGDSPFQLTVPGYFFRTDEAGNATNDSVCGNDTASERAMMRKYIVDSVTYWATEYNLDGFRFDLMGLHDVKTMQEVRKALDAIDPSIVIVGEGWDMCSVLPKDQMAIQRNADQLLDHDAATGAVTDDAATAAQSPSIAFFNDSIRDSLKGHVFEADELGYVSGAQGLEPVVLHNMLGSGKTVAGDAGDSAANYALPAQVVNYAEIHDNFTLYDKLAASVPSDSDETRAKRALLATAAVFLAQGVSEMQVGQEFLRTKGGDENSYISGDTVNTLNWDRQDEEPFATAEAFTRGLIALRRSIPELRLATYDQITQAASVLQSKDGVVAYQIAQYVIVLNANEHSVQLTLPTSSDHWDVLVSDDQVADVSDARAQDTLGTVQGNVDVAGLSATVLRAQ